MKKDFNKAELPRLISWVAAAIADIKGERVTVEIKQYRKHRSLDANAYCWVLIDKLAEKLGSTIKTGNDNAKETIYKNAIRDIGGVSDTFCMSNKAVDKFVQAWTSRGIGWQCDIEKSKLPGCTNVTAYYGSSAFDSSQMSRLIDSLKQDCVANDIEVMPPDKLKGLIEQWKQEK